MAWLDSKVFPTASAIKTAWCGLCGEMYSEGDSITGVRWGLDERDWALCHLGCCDQRIDDLGLRSHSTTLELPLLAVRLVRLPEAKQGRKYVITFGGNEVYATGQEQRAIGVEEFLREHSGQSLFDREARPKGVLVG